MIVDKVVPNPGINGTATYQNPAHLLAMGFAGINGFYEAVFEYWSRDSFDIFVSFNGPRCAYAIVLAETSP